MSYNEINDYNNDCTDFVVIALMFLSTTNGSIIFGINGLHHQVIMPNLKHCINCHEEKISCNIYLHYDDKLCRLWPNQKHERPDR
ncbi:hypothetical protein BEL04_19375 [Mucilaginibacter sp. PPCGB 2223]|nr:hypothetical protein BEL04_19375 [Mucilaginibacter sp. PPCGB 2223]